MWVGVRKGGRPDRRDGTGETLVRVDPGTLGQTPIPVPGGVESLAVGKGAVWVTNFEGDSVTRVDAADTTKLKRIPVGKAPKGVAVGEGAVWVANTADDSVTRINPARYERKTIRLRRQPDVRDDRRRLRLGHGDGRQPALPDRSEDAQGRASASRRAAGRSRSTSPAATRSGSRC